MKKWSFSRRIDVLWKSDHLYVFIVMLTQECQVSVHTYKDVRQHETSENMWMLVIQKNRKLETIKHCQ
jgi:hypothetical protein